MSSNRTSRVFESVADLVGSRGTNLINATVLGYYAPGDGGGSDFYWDEAATEPGDGGMVFAVSGVTAGRWRRRVQPGSLNVRWFGAQANFRSGIDDPTTAFDNTAAFNACQAYHKANPRKFGGIMFPINSRPEVGYGYFFASPLVLRTEAHLFGYAPGSSQAQVSLIFYRTAGVYLPHATHPQGGSVQPVLENFYISSYVYTSFLPYVEGENGITFETRAIIRNCTVSYFRGHGIRGLANVGGINSLDGVVYAGSNANLWKAQDCDINKNAGDGIYVSGGDSNVGLGSRLNVVQNGMYGIRDRSFLGCKWDACQGSDNAVYGGVAQTGGDGVAHSARELTRGVYAYSGDMVRLVSGGVTYHYYAYANSVGVSPTPGASSAQWRLCNYPNGLPAYDPALAYGPNAYVFYQGTAYRSKTYFTGVRPTGDAASAASWEVATIIGLNPMYDYTDWDATTSYQKVYFYAACDESLNSPLPAPGQNNTDWSYQGVDDRWGLSVAWSPTKAFVGGGGFSALHVSNVSVFDGCYSEGGQCHNVMRGQAVQHLGFNPEVTNIGGRYVTGSSRGGLQMDALTLTKLGVLLPFNGTLGEDVLHTELSAPARLDLVGPEVRVVGNLTLRNPSGTFTQLFTPTIAQNGRPAFATLQAQLDYIMTKLPA